jgi:PadR family transcriptional regulator, regulatory protein PadR
MAKRHDHSDGQVLKGLLDTLVLYALADREDYGFGIRQRLADEVGGETELLKEATLYPLLHRLEGKGYLESHYRPGSRGTPRKYYRITGPGRELLAQRSAEWRRVTALLSATVLRDEGENR